jgi:hypothetical protein
MSETKFRQGQNVAYIDPNTGETRIGKYRGINSDGTLRIQGGRFSESYDLNATLVSKPDADSMRKRRNLHAQINRSAITDISAMKG